jgi:gluconokinase
MGGGATGRKGSGAAASRPLAIVVMGVSGSGKSSVAEALARRLELPFLEGDRLHLPESVEKMSKGIPLTDADRWPWLDRIGEYLLGATATGQGAVVSCSALKHAYRERLRTAAGADLAILYLEGSRDLLLSRMKARKGHFMPATLLDSQLATLEDPTGEPGVVAVSIDAPLETVVENGLERLTALWKNRAG